LRTASPQSLDVKLWRIYLWSEIASVRSIETRNDDEVGILILYSSPTTAVGDALPAGKQGISLLTRRSPVRLWASTPFT